MQKHIFYDLWCATDKTHNIKIEYDKTKKIKDQILFQQGHVRLLNVSKSYCDGEYQGVWFLFLVDTDFLRHFKPIDMGFDESIVDDLDSLIKTKCFLRIVTDINESIDFPKTASTQSFNFNYNNKNIKCDKVYLNGDYVFTNYYTDNVIQRGAYSKFPIFTAAKKGNYQCDDDNDSIINYYKKKSVPNLANTITLTSTEYSTISYDFSF